MTIWNQTIPDHLRGRLAGIEIVSYTTGPMLGNAESGLIASLFTLRTSIVSGGILCVLGTGLLTLALPAFRLYEGRAGLAHKEAEEAPGFGSAPPKSLCENRQETLPHTKSVDYRSRFLRLATEVGLKRNPKNLPSGSPRCQTTKPHRRNHDPLRISPLCIVACSCLSIVHPRSE